MSADILSDKELSSLLKLASAAIDNDDISIEDKADLVDGLDFTAQALDVRRGVTPGEPISSKPAALDMDAAPPPPKPARVIVAAYSHKHGEDVRVFASDDGAEAWRQEIAAEWYGIEFGADEADYPADASEMADAYFDRMNERGDESFNTESCEVEPDPAPQAAAPQVYDVQTGLYVTVTSDAEQRA